METALKIIFLWCLYLVSLSIYVFLIAEFLPKHLLKVSGDPNHTLGRGLKKFVYPGGRAVVYAPHPSIRKYVNKYLLFTLDGYKYVQLDMSEQVKNYTARITMYNNQDKVIGHFDVSEFTVATRTPGPVKLHENTSYIALSLLDVNRRSLIKDNREKMQMRDIPRYFIAVVVATFLQFVHLVATLNRVFELSNENIFIVGGYASFIIPSLIIGIVCLWIAVADKKRNGVKVVFKR